MRLIGSDELINALIRDGFQPRGRSHGGSHRVYKKVTSEGTRNVVVVLAKKEIPEGTLHSMMRQAGLSEKQLLELLKYCLICSEGGYRLRANNTNLIAENSKLG